MHRRWIRTATRLALVWGAIAAPVVATAQSRTGPSGAGGGRGAGEVQVPDLAEAALRVLEAPYLTLEEAADLRVFHGVWRESDLESPKRMARAALLVGVYDHPALDDPEAAAEDRAEARLLRGDLEDALTTLAGANTMRARRIRASALEGLGRFDEADAAIEPVVGDLLRNRLNRAEDLVEGVKCVTIRARLRGQPASDYHAMMSLLARARDELDRLYWPALLTEAELLYDKDNRGQAIEALGGAISLNPASAAAWWLRGQLFVDSFNFDSAERAGTLLDALARRVHVGGDDDAGGEEAFSPHADLVLAAAWLRQNDPDLAEEQLAPTLERFPRMREALALRCAIEAVRYDFEATERLLAEFDRYSPGSPEALFAVGKALAETRQYEKSAEYLERASARQPNWPPPLVELGLLELQSGRDDRAATALRAVERLDPFNVRARNSLRLINELLTYDKVEGEHFVVRFQPGVDRVMAEEMLPLLEEIHEDVAGPIRHVPPVKTTIELMPNHEWFAVRIVGMPQIHTIAASTGPVIAMEAPKIGPKHTGEYDWVRVIRHEYVHTVTLSRTKNRIPHWFTEAAAVYLEGAPRDYSTCRLLVGALVSDGLFDMRKINVAFVRPEKPTDRGQAYAQGHWMYEYMVERFGEQAPLDLMDLYAEGLREDAAMRSVLGVSQEEFLESFKVWARGQAASWGMLAEPRVSALLLEETLKDEKGRAAAEAALAAFAEGAGFASLGVGGAPPLELELLEPDPVMVNRWLERFPDHPDVLELGIDLALEANNGAPAEALAAPGGLLERYAAARPVDPMPHRHLARFALDSATPERHPGAAPHLEYLDVREQKSPAYAVELARIYRIMGRLDDAARKAERATQIAPFDAGHREIAAAVAVQRGDYPTAERHLKALVALEPDRTIHETRLERLRQMMGAASPPAQGREG